MGQMTRWNIGILYSSQNASMIPQLASTSITASPHWMSSTQKTPVIEACSSHLYREGCRARWTRHSTLSVGSPLREEIRIKSRILLQGAIYCLETFLKPRAVCAVVLRCIGHEVEVGMLNRQTDGSAPVFQAISHPCFMTHEHFMHQCFYNFLN